MTLNSTTSSDTSTLALLEVIAGVPTILDIFNPLLVFSHRSDHKHTYRDLIMHFHPDRPCAPISDLMATETTAHINVLYDQFLQLVDDLGEKLPSADGVPVYVNLRQIIEHSNYTEYVYTDHIVYHLTDEKLRTAVMKNINTTGAKARDMTNLGADMRKEFERLFPKKVSTHSDFIVLEKPKDAVPLLSAWQVKGQHIDPRTVTWMISRMLNLACYFHVTKTVYMSFFIKNLYVNIDEHQLYPCGGWWSAVPTDTDTPNLIVDKQLLSVLPTDAIKDRVKRAKMLDIAAIKYTARKLIGDFLPSACPKHIPTALFDWMFAPSAKDPIDEYSVWDTVRASSWGKRTFTPWDIDKAAIYNTLTLRS